MDAVNSSDRRAAQMAQIKQWLLNANGTIDEIDLNTDLVDTRVIDSLQFVTFLLFLEELREAEIPAALIDASNFRTLRAIQDAFL